MECKIFTKTMFFTETSNLKIFSLTSNITTVRWLLRRLEILDWQGCLPLGELSQVMRFSRCQQNRVNQEQEMVINHLKPEKLSWALQDLNSLRWPEQKFTWLQKSRSTIILERGPWSTKTSKSTRGKTFISWGSFSTNSVKGSRASIKRSNFSSSFVMREHWMKTVQLKRAETLNMISLWKWRRRSLRIDQALRKFWVNGFLSGSRN